MSISPMNQCRVHQGLSGLVVFLSMLLAPVVLAQPPSFFDTQTRPDRLQACNDESCWAVALADCRPAQFRAPINIDIASADTSMEIWGLQGGSCIIYSRTEQLFVFNQHIPEASRMETICVYKNATDVALEWEVIMGRREGTFGGEGGMIDPRTGIGRNSKSIDGREIAVCDVYMPAAIGQ